MLRPGGLVSAFYCAPLGETLRAMTPLAGDIRRGKIYSLTTSGREAARQLDLNQNDRSDPALAILRALDNGRPLSASHLTKKVDKAAAVLRSLEKKGLIECEDVTAERDPLRAGSARLRVEFLTRPEEQKLAKPERELLSYLELHPGTHNLAALEPLIVKSS